MILPACHSRRQLDGTDIYSLCLHPDVETPRQIVTADVCRECRHCHLPPPDNSRHVGEMLRHAAPQPPRNVDRAPLRTGAVANRPWEGALPRKPWDYQITAAIPVLDTADTLPFVIELLRLQSEPPYILVIDTGSLPEHLAEIEQLRAPDVEVHSLQLNGVRHPSDFPAMAMDLAFTLCRTPYLFATHSDCFLRKQTLLAEMRDLCRTQSPIVGYELSPREHQDWRGMVGHTCTLLDMGVMDEWGAGWSLRRLGRVFGVVDYEPDPRRPHWPDTELLLNYVARAQGIAPHLIGHEENHVRSRDENIDHCRSLTAGLLYDADYFARARGWAEEAIQAARERIHWWPAAAADVAANAANSRSEQAAPPQQQSRGWAMPPVNGHHVRPANIGPPPRERDLTCAKAARWPQCHSRDEHPDQADYICLHPLVTTPQQRVTPTICRTCRYRLLPPPASRRTWDAILTCDGDGIVLSAAVVVISHNYGRFLGEALDSVLAQRRSPKEILVVDDASNDETEQVARGYAERGVAYVRIDAGNVHTARRIGVESTTADVICFLDADDRLGPDYLEQGLKKFTDHRVGIVHSDLSCFGLMTNTIRFPDEVDAARIAADNVLHAGSLVLRSALSISGALDEELDPAVSQLTGDWRLWRTVTRCGWKGMKQTGRYEYRRHADSALTRHGREIDYFRRAWLEREHLQLFIPLSGRRALWPSMSEFLESQRWPHSQISLVLFDTSQDEGFGQMVRHWVSHCDYADVRYVRQTVGDAGLADHDRRASVTSVRRSMARIYNWLKRHLQADYVWILEDDIRPPLDVCERLLRGFDPQTASVAAPYRSRFHQGYVVWDQRQETVETPGQGMAQVGGNGFGCVILRASAVAQQVFTASGPLPDFDHAFYRRLAATGKSAKIDWATECEHLSLNGHAHAEFQHAVARHAPQDNPVEEVRP